MKHVAYLIAAGVMAATAANAQSAFETVTTKSTETVNGVTTQTTSQYVSTTSMVPTAVAAEAQYEVGKPPANSVQVRLPDSRLVTIADSADKPWNKDPLLAGYDRFTFDPAQNIYVAGKGEARFEGNWDDNGNRIPRAAQAPVKMKKAVAKKVVVKEETVAPAEPAAETPAETTTDAPAETPAETPAH